MRTDPRRVLFREPGPPAQACAAPRTPRETQLLNIEFRPGEGRGHLGKNPATPPPTVAYATTLVVTYTTTNSSVASTDRTRVSLQLQWGFSIGIAAVRRGSPEESERVKSVGLVISDMIS